MERLRQWWQNLNNTTDLKTAPGFVGAPERLRVIGEGERKQAVRSTENDDALLHEIRAKPQLNEFIAALLSPFFNVAPVERHNGRWFSRELRALEHKSDRAQIRANIALVAFLTGDNDHRIEPRTASFPYDQNMAFIDGSHYFFDFGCADAFFTRGGGENYLSELQDMCQRDAEVREYIRGKTHAMRVYWESDAGKAAVKIAFDATDAPLEHLFVIPKGKEYSFNDWYQVLLERVTRLEQAIS